MHTLSVKQFKYHFNKQIREWTSLTVNLLSERQKVSICMCYWSTKSGMSSRDLTAV